MLMLSYPSFSLLSHSAPSYALEPRPGETAGGKDALQHVALCSSAHVDVAYNRLHQYLYCNWKSVPKGETLRTEIEAIGHLLRGQGCNKMLNDHRRLGWAHRPASFWLTPDLLAPLRAAGLGKMAWIISSNLLLQLATVLPLRRLDDKGAFLRAFSDESAAKLWLLERRS